MAKVDGKKLLKKRISQHLRETARHSSFQNPKVMKTIAYLPFYKALKYFRIGFELECQALNGKITEDCKRHNQVQRQYREADYRNGIKASYDRLIATEFIYQDGNGNDIPRVWLAVTTLTSKLWFIRFLKRKYPNEFPDLKASTTTYDAIKEILATKQVKFSDFLQVVSEIGDMYPVNPYPSLCQSINAWVSDPSLKWAAYFVDKERFVDPEVAPRFENIHDYFVWHAKKANLPWPSKLSAGTDGTVRGPELRTIGGLTVQECIQTVNMISQHDVKVDRGCSFHIHVSVADNDFGVGHYEEFHKALWEGLMKQWSRLPDPVKDRAKNGNKQYYKMSADRGDRYCAVAYRNKTWEFRLFGGISSKKDQLICVSIALRALHYAITKVVMAKEPLMIKNNADVTGHHNNALAEAITRCWANEEKGFESAFMKASLRRLRG
jgi:hypothetical protein